jgi:sugar transferase (PEP-CTERM/EpsH1 system associated)
MKIAWVKAGGLVPLDSGGKLRSFHIAKELARLHEVTLFTFYAEEENDEHPTVAPLFHKVVTHPMKIRSGRGIGEALRYLATYFSSLPYVVAKYYHPDVARHLRTVLAADKYDVIICDFLTPAPVIPFDWGIPVVVFTHNVEAMIWKRHWDVAENLFWRLAFRREYHKMQATELRILRQSAHVLTVSDTDTDFFARQIDRAKLTTVPTGVDTDYFRPATGETPDSLVFTGSMDWMPNEDGILYFVDQVLPLIRQRRPNTELWVVGRKPGKRVELLAESDPGIQVTGRVEDVRPYIAKGSVYIVPLRVGGGTRLKIFEAMAMGKAVVSTTIGAEGLPVTTGSDIILADHPELFANAVCDLLESSEKRNLLGQAARKLVEERYSWATAAKHVDNALRLPALSAASTQPTG